jgi:hypothetical protein
MATLTRNCNVCGRQYTLSGGPEELARNNGEWHYYETCGARCYDIWMQQPMVVTDPWGNSHQLPRKHCTRNAKEVI